MYLRLGQIRIYEYTKSCKHTDSFNPLYHSHKWPDRLILPWGHPLRTNTCRRNPIYYQIVHLHSLSKALARVHIQSWATYPTLHNWSNTATSPFGLDHTGVKGKMFTITNFQSSLSLLLYAAPCLIAPNTRPVPHWSSLSFFTLRNFQNFHPIHTYPSC